MRRTGITAHCRGIRGIAVLLLGGMLLAGCGQTEDSAPVQEEEPAQQLYPVSVNGTEIRVGETTVQTLLDQGFSVTVSEMDSNNQITKYEIDPDEMLDSRSYYSGASVFFGDHAFAHISMATGVTSTRMADAVIARLEFYMSGEPEDRSFIALNGVPVSEITQEKAQEMFPDFDSYDYYMRQSGDDYEYVLNFSTEDNYLYTFTVEKEYDVDWTGRN